MSFPPSLVHLDSRSGGPTSKSVVIDRNRDFAARYSGEEFVTLFANTSIEKAAVVGEHIRTALDGLRLRVVKDDRVLLVRDREHRRHASPEDTSEAVPDRADKVMFLVKHDGRNNLKMVTQVVRERFPRFPRSAGGAAYRKSL